MAQHLQPRNDSVQEGVLVAFEKILEERVGELRSGLDKVVRDSSDHWDRLNEFSHIMNALREKVIQSLEKQSRATDENISSDKENRSR